MKRDWYMRATGFLLIILIMLLRSYYKIRQFNLYGVYTVGKAIEYQADDQGSTMVYKIYFNNKEFTGHIGRSHNSKEGEYRFIRILSDYPTEIGWEGEEVPECILSKPIPYEGWKELPNCQ